GAHQREDHPGMLDEWRCNQFVEWEADSPTIVRGSTITTQETAA
ncbi:MAG: hypothetical protein ACI89J_001828, partial [Hyphomicrobiaceae bacterium]